jgi:hypothetical protein
MATDVEMYVQERPCTRCIKRNIGHLCHDEPRESARRNRSEHEDEGASNNDFTGSQGMPQNVETPDVAGKQMLPEAALSLRPSTMNPSQAVQAGNMPGAAAGNLESSPQQRELRNLSVSN